LWLIDSRSWLRVVPWGGIVLRRFRLWSCAFLAALTFAGLSLSQPGSTPVVSTAGLPEGARLNWSDGVLIAEGKGTAQAGLTLAQAEVRSLAAARADAQRLLVGALRGVQVTSSTTVQNFELQSDTIRTSIQGVLLGAVPVPGSERFEKKADGSFIARISFAVPITGSGSLAQVLYPELAARTVLNPPVLAVPTVPPSAPTQPVTPENAARSPLPLAAGAPVPKYSGLIVDARGKGFTPCLNPRVLVAGGAEVFGSFREVSELMQSSGTVAFRARLEDAARLTERGGPGQLLVKALGVSGPNRCDVTVSSADAALILTSNQEEEFLPNSRVTFVN
jgi:hypothetical protein